MKPCFMFETNTKANEFAKLLSKEMKESVVCPKTEEAVYVRDKDYKKAIVCGTKLLSKDRSNIWWIDLEDTVAPIGWVPFIYAEVSKDGISNDGHWKLPTRKQIKQFTKVLSELLGKTVFTKQASCGDVRFYITRTDSIEKQHKGLRDLYLSCHDTFPFECGNCFSRIVLCDFYGKPVKVVKNEE